jgi:hypothetical protein
MKRIDKKVETNYDIVICCMCEKEVDKSNTFIPQICLQQHGQTSHRICCKCWWNTETGFAREGAPHKCPGCVKKLLLTSVPYKELEIVDLTLDND